MLKKFAVALFVTGLAAPMAFAKGHDQGQSDQPGENVKSETVAASHTLGMARGNRPEDKGPNRSRAVSTPQ